jgi:hypothetical protein
VGKLLYQGPFGRIATMNARINNLRYLTVDGLEAPVDETNPNCPFHGPGQSAFGLRVANSFIHALRWETPEGLHELKFKGRIAAALDPVSGCVVINVSSLDLARPDNALIVNADATVNHQIDVPRNVERTIQQLPGKAPVTKKYPVEGVDEVLIQNGRLVIGLGFAHEWVERRTYDVAQRHWGERVLVYRR